MSRKVAYVVPNGNRWQVKTGGQVVSNHNVKHTAITSAKSVAKSAPTGQIVIQKQNGRFQTEHTYGKDPNPPRG